MDRRRLMRPTVDCGHLEDARAELKNVFRLINRPCTAYRLRACFLRMLRIPRVIYGRRT
jgi:hypothetical protein